MAETQAEASGADPAEKKKFKQLREKLAEIRPPLMKELYRIVLRPIIWNTLANLELCILSKSFGTVLEVLETQILTTADKEKIKALRELRKKATAYLKSKPEDKAMNLQSIEDIFVENLKEIPLLLEWNMNFNDWRPEAQPEEAQQGQTELAQTEQVKLAQQVHQAHAEEAQQGQTKKLRRQAQTEQAQADQSQQGQTEQAQQRQMEQAQQVQTKQQQAQKNATNLLDFGIESLKKWRVKPEIEQVYRLFQDMTTLSFRSRISKPKTPLQCVGAHPLLHIMLTNFNFYKPLLVVLLEKYKVGGVEISNVNEHIQRDLDTPLHYAVRSLNVSFIKWLLAQGDIDKNRQNKRYMTPLELICKQYDPLKRQTLKTDITIEELKEIKIKLGEYRTVIIMLLDNGANPDFPLTILRSFEFVPKNSKRKSPIIDELLKMQNEEAKFLDVYSEKVTAVGFELLEFFIRNKDQKQFQEQLSSFSAEDTECFVKKVIKFWLHPAVMLNLTESVNLIVKRFGSKIFLASNPKSEINPADIRTNAIALKDSVASNQKPEINPAENRTKAITLKYRVELKGLLRKACDNGNPTILKLLLAKMDKDKILINDEPILLLTLYYCVKLDDKLPRKADLVECARLMAGNERISLVKTDPDGNTALHIALKYGLDDIAMTICTERTFAFLGVGNNKGETPLDYAKHSFLEEYLDKTVQTFQGQNAEFKIDYNAFSPYYSKKMQKHTKLGNKFSNNGTRKTLSAIGCIKRISNSSKLKPLLNHPVIKIYVQIEWVRWSILHVLNLLFTLLTAVFFVSYTLEYFCHGYFSSFLYVSCWAGWGLFIILRELFQWAMFGRRYFKQYENYFDMANIILMCIVLNLNSNDVGFCILLAALSVIIFAYEIICLAGALSIDIFSTYRWMLLVVAKNFFLSIFAFCPILLAFYYSFYLVYNRLSTLKSSETTASNDTFNTFGTGLDAGVKILVMTIGEFEAATMEIDTIKIWIFIPFILCVAMIIQNLINGLAVSDITEIRGESELINLRNKVHLLARTESGLNRKYLQENIPKVNRFLNVLKMNIPSNYSEFFFKNYSHIVKIAVEKNDCAKIIKRRRDTLRSDSSQKKNNVTSERRDFFSYVKCFICSERREPSEETRITNDEVSQSLLDGDETRILIPDAKNSPSVSSTPETLYVLRIPITECQRKAFKILPLEATLDKTVLRNLQRIADQNQTKAIKNPGTTPHINENQILSLQMVEKCLKSILNSDGGVAARLPVYRSGDEAGNPAAEADAVTLRDYQAVKGKTCSTLDDYGV